MPILLIAGGRDRQLARLNFLAPTSADFAAKSLWLPDMNHMLVGVAQRRTIRELQSAGAAARSKLDRYAGFIQMDNTPR